MARIVRAARAALGALVALTAVVAVATTVKAALPPLPAQEGFATPEDAVAALVAAERSGGPASLASVLGPEGERLAVSGDAVADAATRKRFLDAFEQRHELARQDDGTVILQIGEDGWPLPMPLVQAGGQWRFDAGRGAQELVNRRIGRNELTTIRTLLAMVEAQKDFFDRVRRGTGTGAFAGRILSSPGLEDGLYWDAGELGVPSPLGPLVDQALDEGYPGASTINGRPVPYHGYFFRVLTGSGRHAPGGAKAYLRHGAMTDGYAVIAWPASYAVSGVMTFLVDQDGIVFQRDLGSQTANIVAAAKLFDPDPGWARVDIVD